MIIEIYKVQQIGDHTEPPALVKVASWKESQPNGRGKWVQVDFSETVGEWFKNAKENFGFLINATVNGKKVAVTDVSTEKTKVSMIEAIEKVMSIDIQKIKVNLDDVSRITYLKDHLWVLH